MWSLRITRPFERFSMRNALLFVAAVVAASFALNLLAGHAAYAADAKWNGGSIIYGGNEYNKVLGETDAERHGLPDGTIFMFKEEVNGDRPNAGSQKAHVIYFAPGADPGDATKAQYATYDFTPPDTYKQTGASKAITTEKQSDEDKNAESSCVIPGIGWMVCPISQFLAGAMDWMYEHLAEFLQVRPLSSDQNNSLYEAWSIMRNIANVAFVIAFLFIIYSQVTTMGLSSYGIKKLAPRLVIAAVLVNISYWICAIAIDASNIAGYSLNDLFMYLTEKTRQAGSDTAGFDTNFTNITQLVLSGGTLGAAGALAFLSVGSISGAIYMLLPILVGVLIAALVALIIMAARQAIIVILVIIAPLAFVAYLLPNTEKYFEKWKDIFLTMLMLFPVFGVLFGGSQLAGTAIIQNASSIIMLILGMAVQVAPLVLLPFLIKFGGGLLGRIAGMSNDRTKGLFDQTRQFAQNKAELKKSAVLARPKPKGVRRPLTRAVQSWDNLDRKRKDQLKTNEMLADARWNGSNAAHKLHAAASRAEMMKDIAERDAEAHVANLKRTDAEMQGLDLRARASKLQVDLTQAKVDANWTDLQAGNTDNLVHPQSLAMGALARQVQAATRDEAVVGLRKQSAERKRAIDLTNDLIASSDPGKLQAQGDALRVDGKSLAEYSGGALGATGAETVLAGAVDKYRSELRARISEKQQLLKHFNVTQEDIFKLAMGESVQPYERDGIKYTFTQDDYMQEAAGDRIAATGSAGQIQAMIAESGIDPTTGQKGKTWNIRTSLADAVKEKGLDKKALYYSHNTIDDIAQGKIYGDVGLNMAAARSLANGKATDENVAGMSSIALERMFSVTVDDVKLSEDYQNADAAKKAKMLRDFQANQEELKYSAYRVMHDNLLMRHADVNTRKVLSDPNNQIKPPGTP